MARITKQTKQIADRHIQARLIGTFDDTPVTGVDQLKAELRAGKTFSALLDEIELRYTSITSIILSKTFFHQSKSYKTGVYNGFKILLDN